MRGNESVKSFIWLLITIAVVLTVLSVTGQIAKHLLVQNGHGGNGWDPIRYFDLNRERNLPTWYQGLARAAAIHHSRTALRPAGR